MSVDHIRVVGAMTMDGARYGALCITLSSRTDTLQGELFLAGSLDREANKLLVKAGIPLLAMLTEADLRARLKSIGLTEEEVAAKFVRARTWMAAITQDA